MATHQGARDRRLPRISVPTAAPRPVTPHRLHRWCEAHEVLLEGLARDCESRTAASQPRQGSSRPPAPAPPALVTSRSSSRPSPCRSRRQAGRPQGRSRPPRDRGSPRRGAGYVAAQGHRCRVPPPAGRGGKCRSGPREDRPRGVLRLVDEQCDALALRLVSKQVADLDHARGIEAVGGFVEDQRFGTVQQGAGEGEHAPDCRARSPRLPAGPRMRRAPAARSSPSTPPPRSSMPARRRATSRFSMTVEPG